MNMGHEWKRRIVRLVLVLAVAAVTGGQAVTGIAAQEYGLEASGLDGIEHAVGRFYYDEHFNSLDALVFRFENEERAALALEALDPANGVAGSDWEQDAITIDTFGPNARAYHWQNSITGMTTVVMTQQDVDVYVVDVTSPDVPIDTTALAIETMTAMMAADAGEGLGEFDLEGGSTGGIWNKLPAGDGQSPAGFLVEYDEQYFPQPPETGDDVLDFSQFEGAQRAVARIYSSTPTEPQSAGSIPAATYYLTMLVAEFDSAGNAGAALDPIFDSAVTELLGDPDLTLETVEPQVNGERVRAVFTVAEEGGLITEVSILAVQEGPYLYLALAVGLGADSGTLAATTAVVDTMIAADASPDEGTYDLSGASTGGLWDKLPASGDEVLMGLEPNSDTQVYPEAPSARPERAP